VISYDPKRVPAARDMNAPDYKVESREPRGKQPHTLLMLTT